MEGEQDVFLVTQREIGVEQPEEKDLYQIGTVSHIRQILRLSSGSARVMVEGRRRARLRRLWQSSPYLQANIEVLPEEVPSEARSPRAEALLRQAWSLFSEYAQLSGSVPGEIVTAVMDGRDVGYLADFIAQNIPCLSVCRRGMFWAMKSASRPTSRLSITVVTISSGTAPESWAYSLNRLQA